MIRTLSFDSRRYLRTLSILTLAVAAGACARQQSQDSDTAAPSAADAPATTAETSAAPSAAPSAAGTPGVTDANIAAIVVAANTVDIRAGELALQKAASAQVRQFGQQMITDHGAVNQSAVALVTKLGVTPEENATSKGLTAGGDSTRARLGALSGAAFDRAYIDNEVAYHKAVIDALDNVLVPSAKNTELKATLISVRPAFVAHMQHAQRIQQQLGQTR